MKKSKTEIKKDNEYIIQKVILLIVGCFEISEIKSSIINQYKISNEESSEIIQQAQQRLIEAAEIDKRKELGTRLKQLDELYKIAVSHEEPKLCLDILKERSALCNLYQETSYSVLEQSASDITNSYIRKYLESIEITEKDLPLEELTRQVAVYFINTISDKGS